MRKDPVENLFVDLDTYIVCVALTHWYEGYYEVWLGGKYFLRLEEMHKQYGMKAHPLAEGRESFVALMAI